MYKMIFSITFVLIIGMNSAYAQHNDFHPRIPEYKIATQILNVPMVFIVDGKHSVAKARLKYIPHSDPIALELLHVKHLEGCEYDDKLVLRYEDCSPRFDMDKDMDKERWHGKELGALYDPLLKFAYLTVLINNDLYRALLHKDPVDFEGDRVRFLVHKVEFLKPYVE